MHPRPPTHVVKRIAPTRPGAVKLAERFGDRLVCVRYRHDASNRYRYTTVELIVDEGPVKPKPRRTRAKDDLVAIQLTPSDAATRKSLYAHGAVWDGHSRLWYLKRTTAKALNLTHRIV